MGNFYSYLYLSCAGLIFASGVIVLRHNPRQAVNRKYAILCLAVFAWVFGYGASLFLKPHESFYSLILILHKIGYSGVILIPATLWDYIFTFFDKQHTKRIKVSYIVSLLFLMLLWTTTLIIDHTYLYSWGLYPKAGPLHPFFLTIFFITLIALYIDNFKETNKVISPLQKANQAKYVLLAHTLLSFCCIDFIPNYGIYPYPSGPLFITLFLIIIAYTIIKYQLMDIKIIIRKGLVYSVLVSLMTLSYIVFVVAIESLLQNTFGYRSVLVKILTAFGFGLTLIPLRNRIQKFVDHYFFKGSPEELSDQIEKYSVQAQESDKYKMAAKLAGNVAHEIKNPLTAIKTFVEQFPNKKNDPEFMNAFHKLAASEINRIQNLSMQLTDFAKPTELKISSFDLHQLLDDVLLLTNQRIQNNKILLKKEFASENITINADKDQLKQVFLNLILNAADAMEHGGMLTVSSSIIAVSSHLDPLVKSENDIMITITDTGCGISPENLKKLFEPFFTTKKDGTGLGLSICKRIIETHGGKIEVKSGIDKGTDFSITLPVINIGETNA